MNPDTGKDERAAREVSRAIARIQSGVLTVVFATICGGGLFVMTAWLVIKDGPHVGQHLQLLRQYFPGYTVTWSGSIVGFLYGALVGGVIGWSIGTIYNKIVGIRHVVKPERTL